MDSLCQFCNCYLAPEIITAVSRDGLKALPDLIVIVRIDVYIIEPVEILA